MFTVRVACTRRPVSILYEYVRLALTFSQASFIHFITSDSVVLRSKLQPELLCKVLRIVGKKKRVKFDISIASLFMVVVVVVVGYFSVLILFVRHFGQFVPRFIY